MANFTQFTYKECLPLKSFNALPQYLRITQRTSDEVLLLRLLSGTCDFKNTVNKTQIKQRINYSKFDYEVNTRISAQTILNVFKEAGISLRDVEHYYNNCFKYGNRGLFKNLLLELSNYFYQKELKSDALAFLHSYRSIELVSYCFPLYYASRSTSYERTYVSLKDFFNKVDGELNFFRKFVVEVLFRNDTTILDTSLIIDIVAPKTELQTQYFNALRKLCLNNSAITIKNSTPNSQIIITRRGLTNLIFDLRNRYFHLLSGDYNNNFSSSELAEVNYFYKIINDIIMNWLSLIYFEVLTSSMK